MLLKPLKFYPTAIVYSIVTLLLFIDISFATEILWGNEVSVGDISADTIWDAKGDLVCADAADSAVRLAIGANTEVLIADDGEACGVKWGAATGHGNGANCATGEIPLGVDAVGAVEGCYEPSEADISDLAHTTSAADLSSGTIPAARVGAAHIDATTEIVLFAGQGNSVAQFDNVGAMTRKAAVPVTQSGSEVDGDFLVYNEANSDYRDIPMSGDATMDETGDVTLNPALNLVTTGIITGAISVITTTDGSESPTMYGQMYIADHATAGNDTTYTLPAVITGMSGCFYDFGGGAGTILLSPNAADNIVLDGTAASDDEDAQSPGADGDFLCLLSDGTSWYSLGRSGAWGIP